MRRPRPTLRTLSRRSDTGDLPRRSWNSGKPVGSRRILSDDDFIKLVRCLNENGSLRDRALFAIWVNTGARGKDVRELLIETITAPDGSVLDQFPLLQGKTKTPVLVFLLPQTVALLEAYLAETGKERGGYLFIPTHGPDSGSE